jgi:hypothetical protein
MKPLATPVLGGMVSSLLHVLIVTPAIFYSLRARELRSEEKQRVPEEAQRRNSLESSARATGDDEVSESEEEEIAKR